MPGKKRKPGRPSEFTTAKGDEICEWLAEGKSLRAYCSQAGKPAMSTVLRWVAERPEFQTQYALAKEVQAETLFDEILEIADDPRFDWVERYGRDGQPRTEADYEHIHRSRLRVDTRKWRVARMFPKKYGDKGHLTVAGDGEAPLTFAELTRRAHEGGET